MRPSHAHAPGLPKRLPDQPVIRDRQGNYVSGGKTVSIEKLIYRFKIAHAKSLREKKG